MSVASRAIHVKLVAVASAEHPRAVRYLPRLAKSFGHSTLELRQPWLPFEVIDLLAAHVAATARVFEYGGGGSTAWFADRVGTVVTVEHDAEWAAILDKSVGAEPNVHLMAMPAEDEYREYVESIDAYPDSSFDVVVVDGRERVRCFEHAISKVKPGGLLLLDDIEREKYARALDLVSWPRKIVHGFAPCKAEIGHTAVFTRPSE